MKTISKEEYESILFDPNLVISESRGFKRSLIPGKKTMVVKLYSNGTIIAKKVASPTGVNYYRIGE